MYWRFEPEFEVSTHGKIPTELLKHLKKKKVEINDGIKQQMLDNGPTIII